MLDQLVHPTVSFCSLAQHSTVVEVQCRESDESSDPDKNCEGLLQGHSPVLEICTGHIKEKVDASSLCRPGLWLLARATVLRLKVVHLTSAVWFMVHRAEWHRSCPQTSSNIYAMTMIARNVYKAGITVWQGHDDVRV